MLHPEHASYRFFMQQTVASCHFEDELVLHLGHHPFPDDREEATPVAIFQLPVDPDASELENIPKILGLRIEAEFQVEGGGMLYVDSLAFSPMRSQIPYYVFPLTRIPIATVLPARAEGSQPGLPEATALAVDVRLYRDGKQIFRKTTNIFRCILRGRGR